jgi:hypothetical protein
VAVAAQILGVVKVTLYKKIRHYGLEPQRQSLRGPAMPRPALDQKNAVRRPLT